MTEQNMGQSEMSAKPEPAHRVPNNPFPSIRHAIQCRFVRLRRIRNQRTRP
jgi:hypothetical protein